MDDAQTPEPAPAAPGSTLTEKQAAVDAELADLKARVERHAAEAERRVAEAEAKAADAEKKSQDSAAWFDAHLAQLKAIFPQ